MANRVGRPELLTKERCLRLVKMQKARGLNLVATASMGHVPYITLVKALERHGLKTVKHRRVTVSRTRKAGTQAQSATA